MSFISDAKNKGNAIWNVVKRETGKESEDENKNINNYTKVR